MTHPRRDRAGEQTLLRLLAVAAGRIRRLRDRHRVAGPAAGAVDDPLARGVLHDARIGELGHGGLAHRLGLRLGGPGGQPRHQGRRAQQGGRRACGAAYVDRHH